MVGELPSQRLKAAGINLLETRTTPAGRYANVARHMGLLFVAGHGPLVNGRPVITGRVPSVVSVDDAVKASRLAALNCLSSLADHVGNIDLVGGIVRIFGMVNADPEFEQHATVLDGASELVADVFADSPPHVRAAVGMSSLPFGISVEIEMIAWLKEG